MLKRRLPLFGSLALAAAFAFALTRLFELRFDRGDLYPPYSTLRTDPLGSSVFYEGLRRIDKLAASRYFNETWKETGGKNRALFILGLKPDQELSLPVFEFQTIQRFVASGGRVVLAFSPVAFKSTPDTSGKTKPNSQRKGRVKPDDEDESSFAGKRELLENRWGFHRADRDLKENAIAAVIPDRAANGAEMPGLPSSLSVHTSTIFESRTNGWEAIYERDGDAVLVERKFGKGTVVLAADAYWLSNEAMLKERSTGLLAWFVGGAREIFFDEAHLGVVVRPSVALLLRKYHLHGLIFGLVIVVGLFIWKNSSSLVPPRDEGRNPDEAPRVAGKDSIAGLINLLRRSVPAADVLRLCHEEWIKSTRGSSRIASSRRREIERLMGEYQNQPIRERDPAAGYRALSSALRRR